ncbi:hypothetical protein ACJJTC_017482 [Scirpophaga incertulas]
MKIWNWVCLVLCLHQPCVRSLLPGINVLKIIPEILGPTATDYTDTTTSAALSSDTENTTTTSAIYLETENLDTGLPPHYVDQEFQEPLDELISIVSISRSELLNCKKIQTQVLDSKNMLSDSNALCLWSNDGQV